MTPYSDYVREVARRLGVREDVALAMVEQESGWKPERVSPAGAIGLTQLMPATAAERGVDPWNWQQSVEGGIGYLGDQIKRFGSVEAGLAAYNGGPRRFDERGRDLSRMPEETRNYVHAVMARTGKYAAMQQNDPSAGRASGPTVAPRGWFRRRRPSTSA